MRLGKALIFDFDHTIVENVNSTDNDILAILRQFDEKLDESDTFKYIQEATSDYGICRNFLKSEDVSTAYQLILELNIRKVDAALYRDDLIDAIKVLSMQYPLFVLSGRDQHSLNYSLLKANIFHLFKEIIGDDLLTEPKPNPTALIKMADRHHLSLQDCLYIGDNYSDYHLTISSGCHFLGAAWYHNCLEGIPNVCYRVEDLLGAIQRHFSTATIYK